MKLSLRGERTLFGKMIVPPLVSTNLNIPMYLSLVGSLQCLVLRTIVPGGWKFLVRAVLLIFFNVKSYMYSYVCIPLNIVFYVCYCIFLCLYVFLLVNLRRMKAFIRIVDSLSLVADSNLVCINISLL